jgi:hypothetical protein
MSEELFDAVARALAEPMGRRRALGVLAGALVAGAGVRVPRARALTAWTRPGSRPGTQPTRAATGPPCRPNPPFGYSNCPDNNVCCGAPDYTCCPANGWTCCGSGCCGPGFKCTDASKGTCERTSCPDGSVLCGRFAGRPLCCPEGATCCNAAKNLCCPKGTQCVDGVACVRCSPGRALCGRTCCPKGKRCVNGKCERCPSHRRACGKKCCPKGHDCCFDDSGKKICCDTKKQSCCMVGPPGKQEITCCAAGTSCAPMILPGNAGITSDSPQVCCPPPRVVPLTGRDVCCAPGYVSMGGKLVVPSVGEGGLCCPAAQACGSGADITCCSSNQVCRNGACVNP